nr:hypothetical protein [Pseudomonas aeruginosa]
MHGIFQASLGQGLRAANPALAQMLGYDDPQQVLWSLEDMAGQLFVGGEAEMRRISRSSARIRRISASPPTNSCPAMSSSDQSTCCGSS